MGLIKCTCIWAHDTTNHGADIPIKVEVVDPECPAGIHSVLPIERKEEE